jgi:hypothetical protein
MRSVRSLPVGYRSSSAIDESVSPTAALRRKAVVQADLLANTNYERLRSPKAVIQFLRINQI